MIRTLIITFIFISSNIISSDDEKVKDIFNTNNTNQIIMDIEAALARAQSSQGIIPEWAANEITAKANDLPILFHIFLDIGCPSI